MEEEMCLVVAEIHVGVVAAVVAAVAVVIHSVVASVSHQTRSI